MVKASGPIESRARMREAPGDWRLRPVTRNDVDGLYALACKPLVFRYLFDGTAPDKEVVANRIERSIAAAAAGLGMWVLGGPPSRWAGCVRLQPEPRSNGAELTYLLDPRNWGRGLAVRMAWTAIERAFRSSQIDFVFAGADGANVASIAVMRRLGMRFRQTVRYPLGNGVEYVLHRLDGGPSPPPEFLPMS